MSEPLEGVVVQRSSSDVRVDTPGGSLRCVLRGRLRGCAPVVAGDRVVVLPLREGEGRIENILPRRSELVRGTASGKPIVVAANLDRLLVMLSAREPPPRWALVDRMLASAARDGLEAGICLNKWERVAGEPAAAAALEGILSLYRGLGYAAFAISALRSEGIAPLEDWLQGRVTAISGHSGVGKTTLINAMNPSLTLRTGVVSTVTGKGRHTTSAVSLYPLPLGGYVADTPGFREFALVGMTPAELGRYYPEFQRFLSRCRYQDCLHSTEPACAVRQAVQAGDVSKFRFDNYLQILSRFYEDE
jgi:ribosome biogenesis GTPase